MNSAVTVICLCYNHARFVRLAIESVINQTYPALQIIVVDDASTDGSASIINELKQEYPQLEVLLLKENNGSCKAFNRGLALAKGEFVIDFATDDLLLSTRIETGVRELNAAGPRAGVHFSDAQYIDEGNNPLYLHSDKYPHASIPQGNIYKDVIQRYFICPPTLMMRRTVIESLGGFDERLLYEDFDFLIRSSRNFDYCYSREVLVQRRIVKGALSSKQFTLFSRHARSTYHVCLKILDLNKNKQEQQALRKRIYYELKVNMRYLNVRLVVKYLWLLFKNSRRKFL